MMPRKKRIAIIITIVILSILIISGILGVLYLKTDAFKSNETLFAKYLVQNFNIIEEIITAKSTDIENIINNNKYEAELTGKIEYTENINTSDENKDNPINEAEIKINSQTDKTNNYYYKDIKIVKDEENLMRAEYINKNQIYGIRLNGIKQFVSIDSENLEELSEKIGIENLEDIFKKVGIQEIINLTEKEKETLINTYLNVIKTNISKDKYYKQSNSLITVNNKDVKTNAYYIKLTREEYNNLYIKILEQIKNDKIILSKIDKIEEVIKEKYTSYNNEEELKEGFKQSIDEKIEEIENNNIGGDEVKITVYESNMKTIRTSIETTTNKLNLDLYNNIIKIDNVKLGNTENEQIIKIEKENSGVEEKVYIEYEVISENEVTLDSKFEFNQIMENNNIKKIVNLKITNEQCKTKLSIIENKEIVENFNGKINLENDNVELNDLSKEQIENIGNILGKNFVGQIEKFNENVPLKNYIKMLQNLSIIKKGLIQISNEVTVTETEKNRFNSQFQFFESENLTTDNIKELLGVAKDKLYDINIVLKNGETEKIDISKLGERDYIENIEEIDLKIKQNSTNDDKKEDLLKLLEKNNNKKYNVSLEYNEENGLVQFIKIKIVK